MDYESIYKETFYESVYETCNKQHLKEDRVKNYIISLHDNVLGKKTTKKDNIKISTINFNKERLDKIRGVIVKDRKGNILNSSIRGNQDRKMYYVKDNQEIEIKDKETFVKIAKDTYKKLYGDNDNILNRVEFAADWFFTKLKSSVMNNPREEILPNYGKKTDDYGD